MFIFYLCIILRFFLLLLKSFCCVRVGDFHSPSLEVEVLEPRLGGAPPRRLRREPALGLLSGTETLGRWQPRRHN